MRRESDGAVITQFDYLTCETLGLLKMDFLGLRNLTVIDDALRNIVINGKDAIDLDEVSKNLTDQNTYDLLARGDTLGVFQFDGGLMQSLLRLMRPDNFEDISAVGALYRPGPMGANSHTNYALRKNGQQEVTPIHPELAEPLEEILGQTHGLIVYQEQVMSIAQKVAGYLPRQGRPAAPRDGQEEEVGPGRRVRRLRVGMKANGFSPAAVKTLWDILVPFADYAFNKAHSAAYGLISYWTAFLKANYPAEYMAALPSASATTTSGRSTWPSAAAWASRCCPPTSTSPRRTSPPSAPTSASAWPRSATGHTTSWTRSSGRGRVRARSRTSPTSRKIDAVACNKKVIESLCKAGAFDSLGHSRQGLVTVHANAVDMAMSLKRKEAEGQFDLFGASVVTAGADDPFGGALDIVIPTADWSKSERLVFERDMLGLYVSDHPLHGVEHVLTSHADTAIAEINAGGSRTARTSRSQGILTAVGPRTNKQVRRGRSRRWRTSSRASRCCFFPKTWAEYSDKVVRDQIVVMYGLDRPPGRPAVPVRLRGDGPEISEGPRGPVLVSMPAARCTPPVVERLRESWAATRARPRSSSS